MRKLKTPIRQSSGFTLIEMLVVAALIAIFAGLAVFNIVEQMNREKEKAAISECRSIATALSFAHDDLGFYPKLNWLKMGQTELLKFIQDRGGLPGPAIDTFGRGDNSMLNRIQKNWGEKYMAGSMPDKYVRMTLPEGLDVQWPADPFGLPYVPYLLKIAPPAGNPAAPAVVQWANGSVGDRANYFAGVVSYGRNKVPGFVWNDPNALANGAALRMFVEDPADKRHFTMDYGRYNDVRRDWFVLPQTGQVQIVEPFNNPPHMRDAQSDDKYFEF